MSWLSDRLGVNVDSGLRVADSLIHAINPSTSYEGSDVVDQNNQEAARAAAETKAKLARAKQLLMSSQSDLESSTFSDLFSALSKMESTGNYSQNGVTLADIEGRIATATGKYKDLRALGVQRQNDTKGRTSTLLGGQRYEQLLTKETIKQQEIGTKPKGTLLTEDTIMATNKKAGI